MGQHASMFFVNSERYGWTEDYNYLGATDLASVTLAFNTLVTLRAKLLSADCSIPRVRIESTFKRYPLILDYENSNFATGKVPGTVNDSDDAVIIRLDALSVGYNRIFMRGLSDGLVTGDQFTPDPTWDSNFTNFSNLLVDGDWAVLSHLGNQQPSVIANAISPNAPKGIRLTVASTNVWAVGQQLRISGASIFGYNGVKTVVSALPPAAGLTVYLLGGAQPQAPDGIANTIHVTPLDPQFGVINGVNVEQYTLRKAGRPFGVRRGRARTVLSQRP